MKKCLILILCFALAVAFGCSTSTMNAAVSPEPVAATPAPLGGDSTVNGERNVTDGDWLYYLDYSESRLYRVNATLENAEMIYNGGFNYISLDGDEVWFWDWKDQLHHVSANGTQQVVFESKRDIAASWLYEGSLYLLQASNAGDIGVNSIKRLDLNTMEVVDLTRTIKGLWPLIIVSAGHIFFTEAIDEMSFAHDLYQINLDGTNEVQINSYAYRIQLLGDKLYYNNDDGLWAYNVVTGETERIRDDPGRPCWISDGMLYYSKTSGDTAQLVCAPLSGGEETVLFPGHEASNLIVIWDDMIYFDEYKPNGDGTTKYYVGSLAGKEAILWDSTIPSDYSNVKVPDDLLNNPDTLAEGTSWLYLEASATLSACYRLYDTNGALVQQVLLSPNESKKISFPSGYYILKIAEGTNWINDDEAFGPDGEYSSTSNFGFEANSTYRIGSGNRGDFHGTDQSGF